MALNVSFFFQQICVIHIWIINVLCMFLGRGARLVYCRHWEWFLNHRMLSHAVNSLIRETILQLQSLISIITQFQFSFPGLKWERLGISVLLWLSGRVTVSLSPSPGACAYPLCFFPLSELYQHYRLRFMFYQHYWCPKTLEELSAASFQMSHSD